MKAATTAGACGWQSALLTFFFALQLATAGVTTDKSCAQRAKGLHSPFNGAKLAPGWAALTSGIRLLVPESSSCKSNFGGRLIIASAMVSCPSLDVVPEDLWCGCGTDMAAYKTCTLHRAAAP